MSTEHGRANWTPEFTEAVRAAWEGGVSTPEICGRFGVSKSCLIAKMWRIGAQRQKAPPKFVGLSAGAISDVCKRYAADEDTAEIARAHGLTGDQVRRIANENGFHRKVRRNWMNKLAPEQRRIICMPKRLRETAKARVVAQDMRSLIDDAIAAGRVTRCPPAIARGSYVSTIYNWS